MQSEKLIFVHIDYENSIAKIQRSSYPRFTIRGLQTH